MLSNHRCLQPMLLHGGALTIAPCLYLGTLVIATDSATASSATLQPSNTPLFQPTKLQTAPPKTRTKTLASSIDLFATSKETALPDQTPASLPPPVELSSAGADLPEQYNQSKSTEQDLLSVNDEQVFPNPDTLLLSPEPTLAQVRPGADSDDWQFVIQPYVFVPFEVDSDITVDGLTASASVGLGDILNLDDVFSGALRLEARAPQYGFFVDLEHIYVRDGSTLFDIPLPFAADLAVPTPANTSLDVDVTATSRITTLNLGGYYRLVDEYLGKTSTNEPTYPRLLFDPFAGVRVSFLSGSLDFEVDLGSSQLLERSLDESVTLFKPLLGGQLSLELSDQWGLGLRGDISGFDIDGNDVFAWSVLASARYGFSPNVALQLAYQYKESNYNFGEGSSEFGIDQSQHGIWAGLDFAF